MGRVDALVMGRNTFEKVLAFGEWPYGDTPVIVLTRSPMRVPRRLAGRVEVMAGPPAKIVERLGRRGLRRLYVDGGRTVQGFLASGLIDELTITRIPILLGRGLALFGPLPGDMRLRHVKTRAFASGFVQSLYEVIRRPEPRKARPLTRTGPQASGSQTRRPQ